jgi:hypothetical protein
MQGQISGTISNGEMSSQPNGSGGSDPGDLESAAEAALARGDDQAAIEMFMQVCAAGSPEACLRLGRLLDQNADLQPNPYGAIVFYTRGCDLGLAAACDQLRAAYATTEAQCRQQDAAACMASAVLQLSNFTEIPYSPTGASDRFTAACELGHGAACTELGYLYAVGQGLEKDQGRAAELFEQACTETSAIECTRVAKFYLRGRPVAVDVDRAVAYFERGCTFGELFSCRELGNAYLTGSFVEADSTRAGALLQRACAGGLDSTCADIPAPE